MDLRKAISAIEKRGILLVYPINNKKDVPSIWSEFYPRTEMRWEWDSGGDHRVADMWHLRARLMESHKVAYAKWYQGRATFFSHEVFAQMLAALGSTGQARGLSAESRDVLNLLLDSSPLSTKALKKAAKLQGQFLEAAYNRTLKDLWTRLLIVGVGEVDDGAFPSLAVGASQVMHEEVFRAAAKLDVKESRETIETRFPAESAFGKFYRRVQKESAATGPAPIKSTVAKKAKAGLLRYEDLVSRERD